MSKKKTVSAIFAFTFLVMIFSSCQNFVRGAEVVNMINAAIEHENAAFCKVRISANISETSVIGPVAGIYDSSYKPADPVSLSFEPTSAYKFMYWEAQPAGSVEFDSIKSLNTIATILNDNNGDEIIIRPVCVLRPIPRLEEPQALATNPKDSHIRLSFLNPLNVSDDDLANIKITMGDEDISEYFEKPVLASQNYEVLIYARSDKILDFTSGIKTVKVTVPLTFKYTTPDGIDVSVAEEGRSVEYKINQTTRETATISLTNNEYGKFDKETYEKNLLEEQSVVFTVDKNKSCYFAGWNVTLPDTDAGTIEITADESSEDKTVKLVKYTDEENKTKTIMKMIEPDSADADLLAARKQYMITFKVLAPSHVYVSPIIWERPEVSLNLSAKETHYKNSTLEINFSKKMNIVEEDLKKISITADSANGESVLENFLQPKLSETSEGNTQITYTPDNNNLINVTSGSRTIVVTIPENFSYTTENTEISFEKDTVISYKISSETNDKAIVKFGTKNSGTTKISLSGEKKYNIGDTFTARVTAEDSKYLFKEWFVGTEGVSVSKEVLEVTQDLDTKEVSVKVKNSCDDIEIYPVYLPRPIIVNFAPVAVSGTTQKDNAISITFASEIGEDYDLNKISITKNGEEINNCFKAPRLSEDKCTVIFDPDYENLMTVSEISETVTVTVPADISYKTSDGIVVTADIGQEKKYKVRSETIKKVTVSITRSGSTMDGITIRELSLGEQISISALTAYGYNFDGWTLGGEKNALIYSEDELKNETITITATGYGDTTVSINGRSILYPAIADYEPKYNPNGVECDTTVVVEFNTLIDHATLDKTSVKIKNYKTGEDYSHYFTIKLSDIDNQTVMKLKADESITELFADRLDLFDISISLDKDKICTPSTNTPVNLTGLHTDWYYRINVGTEEVNPHIKEIHLYKKMNEDGTLSGEMTDLDFANWTQSTFYGEFFQNHTRKVFMKIVGYDADSGLSHINLDERLYRTTAATASSLDPQKRTFGTYTTFIETNETTEDGIELYEYVTEIEFNPLYPDGVMKYDFTLEDRAGNKSDVVTYYILKDTGVGGNFIKSMNTLNKPRVSVNGIDSVDVLFSPYSDPDDTSGYYSYMVDPFYGSYSDDLKVTKFEWGYLIDDHMTVVEPVDLGYKSKKEQAFEYYYNKYGWDREYIEFYLNYYQVYYSDVAPVMYRFDRDETRETYIRVYVEDSVGNTYVKTVAIPEKATYATTIDGYDYYNAFNLNCPLDYNAQGTGISYYNSNEPDYKTFYAHHGSAWDVRKNKNTLAYYYVGGEPETRYAAYANHYEINGWTIYGTYSDIVDFRPDNVTALTEEDMPSDLEIITSVKNGIKNMGYTEVTAKYPEGFVKNPNLKYFVAVTVEEEDETKTIYTESDVLHLVYGTTYKISPAVRNEAREFKYGKTKTIAVNDDNIPPYMEQKGINNGTHSWYQMSPNFVKTSVPEDASGMKVSEDGLVHLQYWVIANESVDSYIKEREESEIITYPSKEISYDPENPPAYLRFPLDDSPENSYTVYVKLVDGSVNENYTFMSFYACNIVREAKPTFTYKSDYQYAQIHYNICMDSDWHYHETASSNSYDRHPEWWTEQGLEYLWDDGYLNLSSLNITEEELVHRYIKDCYTYVTRPAFIYDVDFADLALLTVECFDGKNWDTGNFGVTGDVGVFDTQPAQFRQIAFAEAGGQFFEHNGANWDYRDVDYSYFYNVYNTEDFIRIKALEANGNGTIKNYLKTLYLYPKYYKGEMKVDNYNIQELGNGLQVFADAPVLAHTFYCSANLGKDIDLWLNHALETGVVQKESTFTYGESYLKDVPQGKYYVTIVHFANGETAISDVKVKK